MPRNIEIKARVSNLIVLTDRVRSVATEGPVEIIQEDTFFNCEAGRLKLRKLSDQRGELIFYRRANRTGPKESFYLRSETSDPDTLRQSLDLAYGASGRVIKRRGRFGCRR